MSDYKFLTTEQLMDRDTMRDMELSETEYKTMKTNIKKSIDEMSIDELREGFLYYCLDSKGSRCIIRQMENEHQAELDEYYELLNKKE